MAHAPASSQFSISGTLNFRIFFSDLCLNVFPIFNDLKKSKRLRKTAGGDAGEAISLDPAHNMQHIVDERTDGQPRNFAVKWKRNIYR